MNFIRYCKTCGLLSQSGVCLLYQEQKKPDQDFCSNWTQAVYFCENCGSPVLRPLIENAHLFCEKCAAQINTCTFCSHATKECLFQTDPSPIPRSILKNIRQDNMTMQMQVPNPERIRQFCQDKCPCFQEENWCMKQTGWCNNYERK